MKKAFHKLAHQYHPDKAGGNAEDYDLRGKANFKLSNKKGACEDFNKAEQMGFPDAAKDKMSAGCK